MLMHISTASIIFELTVDHSTTVCVPVRGVVDGSLPQLPRLLYAHVVLVPAVEDTVGVRRPGTNAEDVVGQASAIGIHIV